MLEIRGLSAGYGNVTILHDIDLTVEPGTVVMYSDIACPWSHLAVHRLRLRLRERRVTVKSNSEIK